MDLNHAETQELAAFFAKRFPEVQAREDLAARARLSQDAMVPVPPVEAWAHLIRGADAGGSLPRLATAVARTNLEDTNLQEVCRLLGARTSPSRHRTIGLASSVVVFFGMGIGVGAWAVGNTEPVQTDGLPVVESHRIEAAMVMPAAETTVAEVVQKPDDMAPVGVPAVIEPSTESELLTAQLAASDKVVETTPEPTAKKRKRKNRGPAYDHGRCTYANEGDFVGYWYAGKTVPGNAGDVFTVDLAVNVRAQYPNRKNGFNKRAPARCILKRGDRVKLSGEPVLVPGNRYWVPLFSGDVVVEAS